MRIHHLQDFTRGWIVGNFEPSVIRTEHAEFMVRSYTKDDREPKHVHNEAHEITVIVSGKFRMNGQELTAGHVVHLAPGVPADFECCEDGTTAVFKTPSVIGDKYIIS